MAVIALAGRRTDAPDAPNPRFPPANAVIVKERIRGQLQRLTARTLVSSAACGADLLALDAAGELGLKRRIVLPFTQARFRETSVIDRGAEWGSLFDRILAELRAHDDVVTLENADGDAAYAAANTRILDEAQLAAAATADDVWTVLVWDGASRGKDDLTEAFGREARLRGLPVVQVLTTS